MPLFTGLKKPRSAYPHVVLNSYPLTPFYIELNVAKAQHRHLLELAECRGMLLPLLPPCRILRRNPSVGISFQTQALALELLLVPGFRV